uniref:uncharacterized protein LOC118144951 isoform X1 n=1 Tax=Callithrix jacchus TaxID=9483 RepID=UPI00159D6E6F|nr:uncharacterized protein LOC118144951 isoform X1 [Callithrix jacchus]
MQAPQETFDQTLLLVQCHGTVTIPEKKYQGLEWFIDSQLTTNGRVGLEAGPPYCQPELQHAAFYNQRLILPPLPMNHRPPVFLSAFRDQEIAKGMRPMRSKGRKSLLSCLLLSRHYLLLPTTSFFSRIK